MSANRPPAPRWRTALALALALGPGASGAAEPLRATVAERAGRLVATFDLPGAFPAEMEKQLGNGLTNVVALVASVVPARGGPPAAAGARTLEILYDVWEETWAVTVRDAKTPRGRRAVLPDFAALRTFLATQRDLDLGPAGQLPAGPLVLEVRLDLNPVSREDLERTREFIANPTSSSRPGGGSRSVLAAMASMLLREPHEGEEFRLYRSAPFTAADARGR
ncbi:MAG TPA: hypothetical protein VLS93_02940 [Anaeromyxobacteraceae bacterium]|nr:hypothetical protein [Anaeromyxobacteraceae bacterium]